MDLLESILEIGEAMMAILQCALQKFLCQPAELTEHRLKTGVIDRVFSLRRRRNGRKADFPEPYLLSQVAEDLLNVQSLRRKGYARAYRPASVKAQKLANLGSYHVITAGAVMKDPELVLHLLGAVDRNRHTDPVLCQEFDDLRTQQGGVGGQTEVYFFPYLGCTLPGISDGRFKNGEIEKRLAAEES